MTHTRTHTHTLTWCARMMRSIPFRLQNPRTTSGPNTTDTLRVELNSTPLCVCVCVCTSVCVMSIYGCCCTSPCPRTTHMLRNTHTLFQTALHTCFRHCTTLHYTTHLFSIDSLGSLQSKSMSASCCPSGERGSGEVTGARDLRFSLTYTHKNTRTHICEYTMKSCTHAPYTWQ
jgi:hypothetical protein